MPKCNYFNKLTDYYGQPLISHKSELECKFTFEIELTSPIP